MNADESDLATFLSGERQFIIPRFQRNYVWDIDRRGDQQVIDYLEDIKDAASAKSVEKHFMGSLVVTPYPIKKVGVDPYVVIDGQQRLITTTLLLCALRDYYDSETDNYKAIARRLKNEIANNFGFNKVIVSDDDKEIYNKIIDNEKMAKTILNKTSIGKAYNYFRDELKLLKKEEDSLNYDIDDIFDTALSKLQIVVITVSDQDEDPSAIFEGLNYKGCELTRLDLLKNYLLMKYPYDYSKLPNDPQTTFNTKYWVPFQNVFLKNKDDAIDTKYMKYLEEYIRHYLMMDGNRVPKKAMYVCSKNRINVLLEKKKTYALDNGLPEPNITSDVIEPLIQDMTNCAKYYRYIDCVDQYDGCKHKDNLSINNSLYSLKEIKSKTNRCYLLNLFKWHDERIITDDNFRLMINIVESYLIRRTMVPNGLNSNVVDVLFLELCEESIKSPAELLKKLKEKGGSAVWPTDEQVEDFFFNNDIYGSWPYCKMVLDRIDWDYNDMERVNTTEQTIEHIMPQTLSNWWSARVSDDVHDEKQHKLGNLALTGQNEELSNLPYDQKLEIYKDSNHPITRELKTNPKYNQDWNVDMIDSRAADLIERIKTIWPYDWEL